MTVTPEMEAIKRVRAFLAHMEKRGGPPQAIADLRTLLAVSGNVGERRCTVCAAVVSAYPEGMCCHCEEMPWPLRTLSNPSGIDRG